MIPSLKMLGDKVAIISDPDENKTPGGILLPDGAKGRKSTRWGTVSFAGPNAPVQAGNRVLYGRYGFTAIEVDGVEFHIVNGPDLIVVDTQHEEA